jgi:hypothetical protein
MAPVPLMPPTSSQMPMPVPAPPSAFQAGPVQAVHEAASPAEAAGAIPLKPKRREENDAENDWFKQR